MSGKSTRLWDFSHYCLYLLRQRPIDVKPWEVCRWVFGIMYCCWLFLLGFLLSRSRDGDWIFFAVRVCVCSGINNATNEFCCLVKVCHILVELDHCLNMMHVCICLYHLLLLCVGINDSILCAAACGMDDSTPRHIYKIAVRFGGLSSVVVSLPKLYSSLI